MKKRALSASIRTISCLTIVGQPKGRHLSLVAWGELFIPEGRLGTNESCGYPAYKQIESSTFDINFVNHHWIEKLLLSTRNAMLWMHKTSTFVCKPSYCTNCSSLHTQIAFSILTLYLDRSRDIKQTSLANKTRSNGSELRRLIEGTYFSVDSFYETAFLQVLPLTFRPTEDVLHHHACVKVATYCLN